MTLYVYYTGILYTSDLSSYPMNSWKQSGPQSLFNRKLSVTLKMNLKGHLCLWREDSLKEKYNTKYFKIIFYLIFRVCKYVSMGKSIHFGYFCSVWGPILRLAWTSKMHCCKISWLWPATVCSIFTAIDANYTHLDTSIPVLQQLQPWIDTFIRLMLWKLSKIFFFS